MGHWNDAGDIIYGPVGSSIGSCSNFGQGNLQKANLGKLKFMIVDCVDPPFFIDIRGVCACDPDRLAIHFKEYGRMADLYIKRKGEMSCV